MANYWADPERIDWPRFADLNGYRHSVFYKESIRFEWNGVGQKRMRILQEFITDNVLMDDLLTYIGKGKKVIVVGSDFVDPKLCVMGDIMERNPLQFELIDDGVRVKIDDRP